jgi:DNA-directed RNA polymerase subunit H (RpoH/RPB5)
MWVNMLKMCTRRGYHFADHPVRLPGEVMPLSAMDPVFVKRPSVLPKTSELMLKADLSARGTSSKGTVFLLALDSERAGVDIARELQMCLESNDEQTLIHVIVIVTEVTFTFSEVITRYQRSGHHEIEVFQYSFFAIDPIAHILVPAHEPIQYADLPPILRQTLGQKTHRLPRLAMTDVIVLYYHFPEGQLLRIVPKSTPDEVHYVCVGSTK